MSKIDPRKIRTRQLLRDALMTLIPRIGFSAITIRQLTDQAKLNHATFYLHYHDKEDLLNQIVASVLAELDSQVVIPNVENARPVFEYLFEHVARHVQFYQVMLNEPSVAQYAHQIQAHIEAMGLRWLLTASPSAHAMLTPPDLFIHFIGAAYLGVIRWWTSSGMPYTPSYMAAQFLRLTVGGLQSDFELNDVLTQVERDLRTLQRDNDRRDSH